MNKLVLLSFTALTAFVMADDVIATEESQMITDSCSKPSCNPPAPPPPEPCKPPPPPPCKPPPPPCKPKPPVCKKPCPPVPVCNNTLCSAAPLSENGWYLFADALYWHADVDDADWAFKNTNTTVTTPVSGPNHSLDFKWAWGFRVGIGANTDYDQWDTNVYYTWFRTRNSNSVGTSGTQVASDLFGLATPFTQGSINWKISYQMVDWELGRPFYVSKHLSLRPHIGLKGGWINQRVNESFTKATSTYSSTTKNNFWGVGASGGFNSAWTFAVVGTHNFDFFGDFAGALMYGHFDVKHLETGFAPSGLDRNLMVPMLQAMFGMSWDTSFNCNRCHFGLRVGYEFQYWWKQNQMLIHETAGAGGTARYIRSAGDLGLQGLTIDFRFDF